jgi:hypothetical protein
VSGQDVDYNFDITGPLVNNPASFGARNKLSAHVMGQSYLDRHGSPQNLNINAEGSVSISNYMNFHMPVFINFGLNSNFSSHYFIRNQEFNVPIAASFGIKNTKLAFGVAPGFRRLTYSIFESIPPSTQPVPPVSAAGTVFDLSSGVFWSGDQFYLGYSMNNMIQYKNSNILGPMKHDFSGGYRFKVKQHYIYPTLRFSYQDGFTRLVSMNYFQFREDLFSIAAGYALKDAIYVGASARLKKFKLSYMYDIIRSPLTNAHKGNHELKLSYLIF